LQAILGLALAAPSASALPSRGRLLIDRLTMRERWASLSIEAQTGHL
jgi:hypothetical protein